MLRQLIILTFLLATAHLSHADTTPENLLKAAISTKDELFYLNIDVAKAKSLTLRESSAILRACNFTNCTESDNEKIALLKENYSEYQRLYQDIRLLEEDLEALRRDLIYIKLSKDNGRQFAIENISLDKSGIEYKLSLVKEDTDSKDLTYKLLYEKYFRTLKRLKPLLIEYKIPETSRKKSI